MRLFFTSQKRTFYCKIVRYNKFASKHFYRIEEPLTEAWKWKRGMIWLIYTQACRVGGMLRSAFQSPWLSTLTLLQDGTAKVHLSLSVMIWIL